jgi:hypothetical protein
MTSVGLPCLRPTAVVPTPPWCTNTLHLRAGNSSSSSTPLPVSLLMLVATLAPYLSAMDDLCLNQCIKCIFTHTSHLQRTFSLNAVSICVLICATSA